VPQEPPPPQQEDRPPLVARSAASPYLSRTIDFRSPVLTFHLLDQEMLI
jgi:hypothetical protein